MFYWLLLARTTSRAHDALNDLVTLVRLVKRIYSTFVLALRLGARADAIVAQVDYCLIILRVKASSNGVLTDTFILDHFGRGCRRLLLFKFNIVKRLVKIISSFEKDLYLYLCSTNL